MYLGLYFANLLIGTSRICRGRLRWLHRAYSRRNRHTTGNLLLLIIVFIIVFVILAVVTIVAILVTLDADGPLNLLNNR